MTRYERSATARGEILAMYGGEWAHRECVVPADDGMPGAAAE